MRVRLLNLITTPAAVLPKSGLELSMGLSTDDPMVGRHVSEPFDAYLSVYAPDGTFAKRLVLGQVPANRRRLINVSEMIRSFNFEDPHLVILHRVPASLAERFGTVDEPVALSDDTDYSFYRSYVQYAYPSGQGAHGGVIYEMAPHFNEPPPGRGPSEVLTFTTKMVLSEKVQTIVLLLHPSTNPNYAVHARYSYALYDAEGSAVALGDRVVAPFGVGVVDIGAAVPQEALNRLRDPEDGMTNLSFHGICQDASMMIVVLNVAPVLGAVSVEHTHPPQGYLMAPSTAVQRRIKHEAVVSWQRVMGSLREAE